MTEFNASNQIYIPSIRGIDIKKGLFFTNNNRKLYNKLLLKFKTSQIHFEEQFINALNSDDEETALRLVHTLKSVAGNLGATRLYDLCKILEKAHKADEAEKNIHLKLEHTVIELESIMNSLVKSEEEKVIIEANQLLDLEVTNELLQKLKSLVEDYDTDSIGVLEEIIHMKDMNRYKKELDPIYNLLDSYEFDEALKLLTNLSF